MLGDLLRGPAPSSVAAREAILSSSAACSSFENALEMGTARAERLLQSNPVSSRCTNFETTALGLSSHSPCCFTCPQMFPLDFSEKEIVLILKSCEAYGRFALHKEASKDGPPCFSL